MKKKKHDDKIDITWPASNDNSKTQAPKSHHHQPKAPGSDNHHKDEANYEEMQRVWKEKHPHDLPPKPRGSKKKS